MTARDWTTIWQSELSAAATDPERIEASATLLALWADAARTMAAFLPAAPAHDPPGHATRQPPPGAAPAAAAPDARDARIEQLARRIEALERRLAGLPPQPD